MRYVSRRLGFFLLTLWVALTLNFVLPRLMPGNPALAIIGKFRGGVSPRAGKVLQAGIGAGTHKNLVWKDFRYRGEVASLMLRDALISQPWCSVVRAVTA